MNNVDINNINKLVDTINNSLATLIAIISNQNLINSSTNIPSPTNIGTMTQDAVSMHNSMCSIPSNQRSNNIKYNTPTNNIFFTTNNYINPNNPNNPNSPNNPNNPNNSDNINNLNNRNNNINIIRQFQNERHLNMRLTLEAIQHNETQIHEAKQLADTQRLQAKQLRVRQLLQAMHLSENRRLTELSTFHNNMNM